MFLFKQRFNMVRGGHKPAPFIGQVFHLAHSARYLGKTATEVSILVQEAVDDYKESLASWVKEAEGWVADAAARMEKTIEENAAIGLVMSQVHWERFPLDESTYEVVSVEGEMSRRIPNLKTSVGGRVDVLLRHRDEPSGLLIVDHKTTSKPPNRWIRGISYKTQPRIYRLLVDGLYPAEPLLGMIHNVILRPTISWKSWQSFEDYLAEVRDWYASKVDEVGTGELYVRGPKAGQPKPRWDHSGNADKWSESPPIASFLTKFAEPLIPDDLAHKIAVTHRASTCLPVLSNFPTTGAETGRCYDHYGSECPVLPTVRTRPGALGGPRRDGSVSVTSSRGGRLRSPMNHKPPKPSQVSPNIQQAISEWEKNELPDNWTVHPIERMMPPNTSCVTYDPQKDYFEVEDYNAYSLIPVVLLDDTGQLALVTYLPYDHESQTIPATTTPRNIAEATRFINTTTGDTND
jgi:hypothetical protein